jgi:hypothetical protein
MANRLTTALAAYRLEQKKGHDAAVEYTREIITESQIDYSNDNAPRWMKHNAFTGAKLFSQFRKYQWAMAYTIAANGYKAFKGNPEAQRMIIGIMMTNMLMAGSMGLPIYGPALAILGMIPGGGDSDDWEREYKNWLSEQGVFGDVIARGLPALVGADISKNVGMGSLFNPLPFLRTDKQGKEQFDETWMTLMPPAFGTARRMADGLNEFENGRYYDGAAKTLPRWLAGMARGAKLADEGMSDKAGLVRIPSEEFGPWEVAMQAAGIPLLDTSKYYERVGDSIKLTQERADARKDILRRWSKGDDVNDARAEYNAKYPSDKITYKTKLEYEKGVKSRQSKVTPTGMTGNKSNADVLEQIRY